MKTLLLTLPLLFSFSALAAKNWDCADLQKVEGVTYKAYCNFDGSITFDKIRIIYNDKKHRLNTGYAELTSKAFCSLFQLNVQRYSTESTTFKKLALHLVTDGNKITVSGDLESTYRLIKTVTCIEPKQPSRAESDI